MPQTEELVAVGRFQSEELAEIAKNVLDETHVESIIQSDAAASTYASDHSTELLVHSEDVDEARTALNESATPLTCVAPPGVGTE